jgi:tetratricopeptide (TPR) repeat protein
MRYPTCLLVAMCISASLIRAQDQPKFSAAQQEVLDAHKARIAAGENHDYATWSRYVADDCIYSDDDGVVDTNPKAHVMEHWKLPLAYEHEVNPRDYIVHVYSNTAVMNYRVTLHEQFTDADIISEQRYTLTFIKQNGSWLLIAKQWGNLPVNFHKPVAVDSTVYRDYAGQYEWRPLDKAETVSVKDGKLWTDFGENMDEEYFPFGSETFFVKDDLGSVTFVRDAQGHVTATLITAGTDRKSTPKRSSERASCSSVHGGQNMHYFAYLLVALCISSSNLYVGDANGQQPSTSEKQQVSKQGTQNPEAYAFYAKGRSYWDKQTRLDLETAVSYFNQAIAKDPGYALAYAGLADAYAVLPEYGANPSEDIPKSKAAARKAIELDPTLSRPHVDLGGTMMAHDWDFAGGEAEFKKALELDPNDAHAHERYADNLGVLGGREQEALAEINRAHQLDPLSPDISVEVGIIYIDARRFDDAIVVCKKVANENPTFATAHFCLASAYWGKHMYPQVIEEQKVYGRFSGDRDSSEYAFAMEHGFSLGGWQGALRKGIEALLTQRKAGYSPPYYLATLYAELGDKEQAFEWLNTTYQEHGELLMCLKTDFMLDSLRSDPRFAELVRKVGLPQ